MLLDRVVTLFAPTNEAFGALPADVLGLALTPQARGTLFQILAYHTIFKVLTSEKLIDGATYTTLEGSAVVIAFSDIDNTVHNSTIVDANILARNGVSHGINSSLGNSPWRSLNIYSLSFPG